MSGRVYLVGAGCGGPELLTLRAAELLRRCSCVVYDDLIDPAILDLAGAEAERIYMGKRSGRHNAAQAEISALLVERRRNILSSRGSRAATPLYSGAAARNCSRCARRACPARSCRAFPRQ